MASSAATVVMLPPRRPLLGNLPSQPFGSVTSASCDPAGMFLTSTRNGFPSLGASGDTFAVGMRDHRRKWYRPLRFFAIQ